jgi:hypothetical protein
MSNKRLRERHFYFPKASEADWYRVEVAWGNYLRAAVVTIKEEKGAGVKEVAKND